MSNEETRKCPICGHPYVVYGDDPTDQSACRSCRLEARKRDWHATYVEDKEQQDQKFLTE
jgi:hypothetical protein